MGALACPGRPEISADMCPSSGSWASGLAEVPPLSAPLPHPLKDEAVFEKEDLLSK